MRGAKMAWLKRNSPTPPGPEFAREQIEIMTQEAKADEAERRGTYNRPRYQNARQTLLDMGSDAVPAMIEALEQGFERAKRRVATVESLDPLSEERWAEESRAMEEIPSELVLLLGEIGDPRAVVPLAAVFRGPVTPPTDVPAALGKIHTPEAKVVLLGALRDTASGSSTKRGFAAAGLCHWEHGDSEVVEALLEATDEANPGLARQAIHSLVRLGATEAAERLDYLSGAANDERLKEKARDALSDLRN
jgi:HEAT repeat protein